MEALRMRMRRELRTESGKGKECQLGGVGCWQDSPWSRGSVPRNIQGIGTGAPVVPQAS